MSALIFNEFILNPINQLRAPLVNPNAGFKAQVWHFAKAEIVARVVGVFASVAALFEAMIQLIVGVLVGDYREAVWFAGVTLVGSLVGLVLPGRLWQLDYRPSAAYVAFAQAIRYDRPEAAGPGSNLHTLVFRFGAEPTVAEVNTALLNHRQELNTTDQGGRTVLYRAIHRAELTNPRDWTVVISNIIDAGGLYCASDERITHGAIGHAWSALQAGTAMRAFLLNRITRETVLQILEGRSQERGWGEESARMALNLLIDDGNAQARNRTEAVNDSLQVIDGFTADLRSIVGAYAEDERLVGWSSELARLQRNMV